MDNDLMKTFKYSEIYFLAGMNLGEPFQEHYVIPLGKILPVSNQYGNVDLQISSSAGTGSLYLPTKPINYPITAIMVIRNSGKKNIYYLEDDLKNE